MRELTFQEKKEVGGATALAMWATASIAVVGTTYLLARSNSRSNRRGRIVDTGRSCDMVF